MHWRNRRRVRRRASGRSFVYNLRFPGQYFDAETGLNYNYYRDYDPATGRYVESDPIGLAGGVNTYAYADEDPLGTADPFGLFPVGLPLSQILYALKLPTTGDCKESEVAYCKAKCAPARSLGCYVTIRWKLKGIRGGEPIRSEQRTVNCNCEELDGCPNPNKKGSKPKWFSPSPLGLPWLIPVPALP
jgi:RHS repeat-associated protein